MEVLLQVPTGQNRGTRQRNNLSIWLWEVQGPWFKCWLCSGCFRHAVGLGSSGWRLWKAACYFIFATRVIFKGCFVASPPGRLAPSAVLRSCAVRSCAEELSQHTGDLRKDSALSFH